MNVAGFDLNLLKAFDALYAERHVTRAGQRIGLSQSAMGGALTRLREAFDDELFVRSPTGTRSHIRHAERSRHAGPMTFIDFHPVVEGTMTVDASHAIRDRIEAALKADHPDSIISIHVARGQAQAWCDGNRVNPVAI